MFFECRSQLLEELPGKLEGLFGTDLWHFGTKMKQGQTRDSDNDYQWLPYIYIYVTYIYMIYIYAIYIWYIYTYDIYIYDIYVYDIYVYDIYMYMIYIYDIHTHIYISHTHIYIYINRMWVLWPHKIKTCACSWPKSRECVRASTVPASFMVSIRLAADP